MQAYRQSRHIDALRVPRPKLLRCIHAERRQSPKVTVPHRIAHCRVPQPRVFGARGPCTGRATVDHIK